MVQACLFPSRPHPQERNKKMIMNRCRNCFFAVKCGILTTVVQCFIDKEIHSINWGSGCNAFLPDSFTKEKMKQSMQNRTAEYNGIKELL